MELDVENDAPKVRLWKIWPGNNMFLCNGRLISAKERGPFYATFFMVAIPVGLLAAFP